MNINTGKLISNSELFLKKIKEQDANQKISNDVGEKDGIKERILNDFADIKYANDSFKGRFLLNNFKLSKYEFEYSKNQFIDEKLDSIQMAYDKGNLDEIKDIINNGIFNNKNVLMDYFSKDENIQTSLDTAKEMVNEKYEVLSREYKSIEVASQNILSINQDTIAHSKSILKDLDKDSLINTTRVDSKRISQLID